MSSLMRIVSFGDVHMSLRTIERLAPELARADLVILSGDLTNRGGPAEAEAVLAATERHARAVLAVSGNLDQKSVIDFLHTRGVSLHGQARRIGDLGIFGCGGSNRTPFATPTEFSDDQIGALLEQGFAQVTGAPYVLMVCHTPPAHTATDRIASGQHVGSPRVRRFIETHQPDACITGHIHEAAALDHIGRTAVVNAGAGREGGYIVVSVTAAGLQVELKRL
jgi:Icc-related predicted phosphoesterase